MGNVRRPWLEHALCLWTSLLIPLCSSGPPPVCYLAYRPTVFNASFSGCPQSCQYQNACKAAGTVQCVQESDCRYLQNGGRAMFIDVDDEGNSTGYCLGCSIAGCKRCASSLQCEKCADDYVLSADGRTCTYNHGAAGMVILGTCSTLFAWFLVDMFLHHRRPATNLGALRAGLLHRFRMRVRQRKPGNPMYPLSTEMHRKAIVGIDLALFMNWFVLVFLVAIWLTVLAFIFSWGLPSNNTITDVCVHLEPREDQSLDPSLPAKQITIGQVDNVHWWTGLSYFGALVISLTFIVWQEFNLGNMLADESIPMLHKFAVELHGFPSDATDHGELQRFVCNALGRFLGTECPRGVVEVSICYDYFKHRSKIDALGNAHLQNVQEEMDARPSPMVVLPTTSFTRSESSFAEAMSGQKDASDTSIRKQNDLAGPFWVQFLGFFMLGTDVHLGSRKLRGYAMAAANESPGEEEAEELLRSLPSSGTVVVVLNMPSLRYILLRAGMMPDRFREKYKITVGNLVEEPESMQWVNYRQPRGALREILLAAFLLLAGLVIWTLLYVPWVVFTYNTLHNQSHVAFLADTAIGMTIAIGNCLMASLVVFITELVGFRHLSKARLMQLLTLIPCVLLNVICDFMVIVIAVYIKHVDDLPEDTNEAVALGLQLLQGEIFALLVPGYCIVPYLAEPCFTLFLRLWIGILRIKCDTRISKDDGERLLVAGEIDIVNPPLTDMVVITSTFCLTFMMPGEYQWKLFAALIVFAVLTYWINRYRILRWQSTSLYCTERLHRAQCYLWALPLAFLSAAFSRTFAAQDSPQVQLFYGACGFLAHILNHILFVTFVLPRCRREQKIQPKSYYETAELASATYRNTNPIEVLKSRLGTIDERISKYSTSMSYSRAPATPSSLEPTELGKRRGQMTLHEISQVTDPAFWMSRKLVLYRPGREHLQPNMSHEYRDFASTYCGVPLERRPDAPAPRSRSTTSASRRRSTSTEEEASGPAPTINGPAPPPTPRFQLSPSRQTFGSTFDETSAPFPILDKE